MLAMAWGSGLAPGMDWQKPPGQYKRLDKNR
jgi:hypothetical protein